MRTVISIPDDVYEEAERLARRLMKSRSRLYTEALREYIKRHDPDLVSEALNQVGKPLVTGADPAVAIASKALLARIEW
jgi:metal-responsive CopG/Arc/MetJ family transcriptional regulator